MNTNKNKIIYIAALLLFLAGTGWLILSGLTENSVYFLNVAEARSAAIADLKQVRLFGTVAENDLHRHPNASGVDFALKDKDNANLTINVVYNGVVPDAFKPGAEVIVEGGMESENLFLAKTLMTKCPSKYQKENRNL